MRSSFIAIATIVVLILAAAAFFMLRNDEDPARGQPSPHSLNQNQSG